MKFDKFLNIYKETPIIDSSTFSLCSDSPKVLRRQVRGWVEKGYLISLKRGIYIFSENYRKVKPSRFFISNYLISPSYVSLEYALGFYSLIPEKVTVVTSVTTKKTNVFNNNMGKFEYRSIKIDLFFGYKKNMEDNLETFVAFPEKAILDYFYFKPDFKGAIDEFESIRLQNLDILNIERLNYYRNRYNKRVNKVIEKLIEYIEQYKSNYKNL